MAAVFEKTFIQDLTGRLIVRYCPEIVFSKDNLSNQINVKLYVGSNEYAGGGTVTATVIRSDGNTVPVSGFISGNVVSVTLIEACMEVPGQIQVFIRLTSGNVKTTIFAGVFTAIRTETEGVIDPGTIIPSVTDLINQIQTAIGSIPADYSALMASVAGTYDATKTYAVGDYVWYDGQLKRCIVPITTAEAWTAGHWTAVVLGNDVVDLKNALKQDIKNAGDVYNVYSSSSFWQSGYINPTSGANAGSTAAIRLKPDYFFEPLKGVSYLSVNDGYVFYLYAYELDGTYVGSWDGSNFVKAWSYKPLSDFILAGYPQYKFRVALFADDQSIEVTDCSNFIALCDNNLLYNDNYVTNLFVYSNCDKGYVNADGSFHNQTDTKELTTDYIPVTAGEKFTITGYRFKDPIAPNILISYYNSEKVFQTRQSEWVTVDAKTIKLTIPDNISYMRVSVETAKGACQIISGEVDALIRYKYSVADQVYNAETFSEIKTDVNEVKNQSTTVADDLLKRTTEYADLFTVDQFILNDGYSVGGSANYKRSKLIKLNKGESVIFRLNGQDTVSVFSVFSANEMTQGSLLYNVVGRGTNVTIVESYTASVDVYVAFCYYSANSYMKNGLLYVKFSDSLIPIITELTNHNYFKNNNVISVNHRGWTNGAPENTIPAFALSKLQGFEWVETDVRYTSDGVPVLLHDATVNRTSNGTGNVDSFTLEQLKELDFGSWYSPDYAGTRIPTFDEFVLFCKRAGLKIYIELKVTPIAPLVSIVKKYRMQDNVKWISYSSNMLSDVKALLPSAKLAYIVSGGFDANDIAIANGLKTETNVVSIDTTDYSAITDAMITMLIENGIEFEIYTGSPNASYECNQYVSAITSDGFIGGEVMADTVLRPYMA